MNPVSEDILIGLDFKPNVNWVAKADLKVKLRVGQFVCQQTIQYGIRYDTKLKADAPRVLVDRFNRKVNLNRLLPDIRRSLQELLVWSDGLYAIVIADRDGVPIVKVSTESTPEYALRMSFLSTFGNATDQASKLGMGKNSCIISIYENHQVIQISKAPIVIILIARSDANTGHLLELQNTLDPLVQALLGDTGEILVSAEC